MCVFLVCSAEGELETVRKKKEKKEERENLGNERETGNRNRKWGIMKEKQKK